VMRIILIEAGIISALAGIAGYIVGFGITVLAVPFFTESHGVMVPFNPILASGALLLAVMLGLASSIYPALMAAKLDPNEALRAL